MSGTLLGLNGPGCRCKSRRALPTPSGEDYCDDYEPSKPRSARGCAETSQPHADSLGRPGEISVLGDENDFLVAEFKRSSKVDRVIPTQSQVFDVLASATGKRLVDADSSQLPI